MQSLGESIKDHINRTNRIFHRQILLKVREKYLLKSCFYGPVKKMVDMDINSPTTISIRILYMWHILLIEDPFYVFLSGKKVIRCGLNKSFYHYLQTPIQIKMVY